MIWVAQKNDKLNWLLLWYNLNSIKRIHAFTSIFFLSAVAVDVHLLSLMFSFYAFQRFIYSFINSYLILIFHWTRGCVCFLSGCSGAGGFSGRSLYVCIQSVLCSPITLVSTDVENVSLFFISPQFSFFAAETDAALQGEAAQYPLRDKRLHLTAKSKENSQEDCFALQHYILFHPQIVISLL